MESNWAGSDYKQLVKWQDLVERARKYYEHYRALLIGDIENVGFGQKQTEVIRTRQVLDRGSVYRNKEERRQGLGPQDASFSE